MHVEKSKEFIALCEKHDVDPNGIPEITSFEDACKATGKDPASIGNESDTEDELAYKKLKVIIEALNEGWTPDWGNRNQVKYAPWFDVEKDKAKPSGFGLSYYDYVGWYSCATVGSRLLLSSSDKAEYAGKQFGELYEQYMLIK